MERFRSHFQPTFIRPIFLQDNIDVNQDGNFAYTLSCTYIYIKKVRSCGFTIVIKSSCSHFWHLFRSILDLGKESVISKEGKEIAVTSKRVNELQLRFGFVFGREILRCGGSRWEPHTRVKMQFSGSRGIAFFQRDYITSLKRTPTEYHDGRRRGQLSSSWKR